MSKARRRAAPQVWGISGRVGVHVQHVVPSALGVIGAGACMHSDGQPSRELAVAVSRVVLDSEATCLVTCEHVANAGLDLLHNTSQRRAAELLACQVPRVLGSDSDIASDGWAKAASNLMHVPVWGAAPRS